MQPAILFSTEAYAPLATEILGLAGPRLEAGSIERRQFPDGEHYRRLLTPVFDRHVVLLSGTSSDRDTLDIFDLGCAISKYGARSLTLLIPYYGYSTMERIGMHGEVVTAKTRARLLSAIPPACEGNRAFLIELHSPGIPHYFEGNIRAFQVDIGGLLCTWVRELAGPEAILASTDAGRAKFVQSLADQLGLEAAFVYKRRLSGSASLVVGVNADVRDREVLIYDDMIRTGGTLLNAARVYREHGARSVSALATHLVLPGDSLERLQSSGMLERVIGTNSHPRSLQLSAPGFLELRSIGPLLTGLTLEKLGWGWPESPSEIEV